MPLPDLNALPLPDLYAHLASTGLVRRLIELARDEDLGTQSPLTDITSASVPEPQRRVIAVMNTRKPCTVAGLACVPEIIEAFGASSRCRFEPHRRDAENLSENTALATLSGPLADVLTIERTLLNLVSRLSGVATLTRAFLDRMSAEAPNSCARLYDTRKTTPGLRVLEKYAVRCAGANCHRLGLFDAVLIKDNHIAAVPATALAAAVTSAAQAARAAAPAGLRFVEVEVDSIEQLRALLALPPGTIDIVLLDNMAAAQLCQAVALRDAASRPGTPRLELEASGGISLQTLGAIAATGVDRISAGALTHQAVSVDIGLDIL